MRNFLIIGIVLAVLAIGGFLVLNSDSDSQETNNSSSSSTTNSSSQTSDSNSSSNDDTVASDAVTITYTASGFTPSSAKLKVGGTLTWVNESSEEVQIGVNPHPVHTGNKAITDGNFTLDLNSGSSKTVTVSESGGFGYHNHLDPSREGRIVVE